MPVWISGWRLLNWASYLLIQLSYWYIFHAYLMDDLEYWLHTHAITEHVRHVTYACDHLACETRFLGLESTWWQWINCFHMWWISSPLFLQIYLRSCVLQVINSKWWDILLIFAIWEFFTYTDHKCKKFISCIFNTIINNSVIMFNYYFLYFISSFLYHWWKQPKTIPCWWSWRMEKPTMVILFHVTIGWT